MIRIRIVSFTAVRQGANNGSTGTSTHAEATQQPTRISQHDFLVSVAFKVSDGIFVANRLVSVLHSPLAGERAKSRLPFGQIGFVAVLRIISAIAAQDERRFHLVTSATGIRVLPLCRQYKLRPATTTAGEIPNR